ncbi:uncharacterized protein LOC124366750 [Homalodisca vitripennis]|uniref:uncharacterized protein LOC124366750 n=1 Tax=Homalodisca vitripennis TaxID=197043 RepID=UPI001EEB9A2C|nr:uncharacterized protein LOC124366750 [Homalodisca vitripennis]
MEHLMDNLEDGNTAAGVFLDLSKAFDSLDHAVLLSKIISLGSVLGPVLFVLSTGDLPDYLGNHCYPVSYADDTVLISNSKSVPGLEMNTITSVNMAQEYCLRNDLIFNASKTKCLTFGKNKDEVHAPPNLERVRTTKHLGVVIDDRLTWNCHIDGLCKKLSSALFVLKRIKSIGTPTATRTAYHALFETHIRYGIVLWGGSSAGNLQRVLVLQKRAIRIMADLDFRDSCKEAFKTLGIPTVITLYITEVILHAYTQRPERNGDIHDYNTRRANDFSLPLHHSALFCQEAVLCWSEAL